MFDGWSRCWELRSLLFNLAVDADFKARYEPSDFMRVPQAYINVKGKIRIYFFYEAQGISSIKGLD